MESSLSASLSKQEWGGLADYGSSYTDNQVLSLPTMLFMDPYLLRHGQLEAPNSAIPVPPHFMRLLGGPEEVRLILFKYFKDTHQWMPFVSKKRCYEIYTQPSYASSPDTVLLFLAMKLISTVPPTNPRNPRTSLYRATKHFYVELEQTDLFSIRILQAGILLALYELGHAIYPAAFLTIGACARYANALGISGKEDCNGKKVLTLVEAEERRRVWWAIVIIDRSVILFATERGWHEWSSADILC